MTAMSIHARGDISGKRSETSMPLWPYLRKCVWCRADRRGLDELIFRFAEFLRTRLSDELIQQRLRIKRLDVAGAAGHEKKNDRLRLRREMAAASARADLWQLAAPPQEDRGERQATEPAKSIANEFAAVQRGAGMRIGISEHTKMRSRLNSASANSFSGRSRRKVERQVALLLRRRTTQSQPAGALDNACGSWPASRS